MARRKRRPRETGTRRDPQGDREIAPRRPGGRAGRFALLAGLLALAGAGAWLLARGRPPGGASPPAAEFVGAESCRSCHQAEYAAWKGSQHSLSMQPASGSSVLGHFDGDSVTEGGVTSTFFRRGGKFLVRTDASDGTVRDFEVKYTYGVDPLQQYLVELGGGHVQPLPLAWDSRPRGEGGQRWFHLYRGQGIEHTGELHWTGRQQNWNFMCADCHSTNVRKGYDSQGNRFATAWSEIDVGCEACHGPGSRHAGWARAPRLLRALLWRENGLTAQLTERSGVHWSADAASGKPVRSAPRATGREVAVCAQCHSRRAQIAEGYMAGAPLEDSYVPSLILAGLYHADGQQRDEVYTYGSFLQSRMFHAGVTCSDCHEPHGQRLRAPGNQLCAGCHTPARYDSPAHHFHPAGSQGAQCVSCHMPAKSYMLVDARRDHSIRIPRPDQSEKLGTPNACTQCHTERSARWAAGQLRSWYGHDPVGFQRFAEVFHADEAGQPGAPAGLRALAGDSSQPAIVRASSLARLAARPGGIGLDAAVTALTDPEASVRRAALLVVESLPPQERVAVAAPLLRDPSRAVRLQAAWLLAPAASALGAEERSAFTRAADEFVASQRLNADRPENRVTLGTFLAQLGRRAEAVAEYRAALRLSPRSVVAYVNLADLYRADGVETEAERTLRAGISLLPRDATLHHALGLSLVRSGRRAEGVRELGTAASLAPDRAELAYAYAVGLNGTGRARESIAVLERARARHPNDREILFALATFHRDAGEMDEARRYATLLARSVPDDREARALLQSLR